LLPYKSAEDYNFDSEVRIDSEYLMFFPDLNTASGDTLFIKYLHKDDSLLLDRHKRKIFFRANLGFVLLI